MHINFRLLAIVTALASWPGDSAEYSAGAVLLSEHPAITVRVIDYASIPRDTLRQATRMAEAIFRNAGVETEWLPCTDYQESKACWSAPNTQDQLVVKILAPPMEAHDVSVTILGTANASAFTAFVFFDHVEVSQIARASCRSVLLAAVMTHEAGHLLGLEHSQGGIMRAKFSPHDMEEATQGRLRFDKNQARELRNAILASLR